MTTFAVETAHLRVAQAEWATRPLRDRLRSVAELRHFLVEHADALAAAVAADVHRDPGEVVATDVLPVAAACKFLLTDAERVLKPRRVHGRPLWLFGCRDVVHRRPWGVVGLVGTWNYPVFLTLVPLVQALTAGNAVLWKPSEHTPKTADLLDDLLAQAGFPAGLVVRLPGDRDNGPKLAEADVDFVHFTGSDGVGRKLAARLGERLIPSTLELSGVDALVVRADADVELAARSAWYGATLNGGQTCLATRRVFVHEAVLSRFVDALRPLVEASGPVRLQAAGQAVQADALVAEAKGNGCEVLASGGRQPVRPDNNPGRTGLRPPLALVGHIDHLRLSREAAFAPLLGVTAVAGDADAVARHNAGPFGLGAALFTRDPAAARRIASQLRTGSVVVNDVIVPTAHPATPFGGRGASGWGVSQGAEGLLGLTAVQVVTVRRGTFRPHVDAHLANDPAAADVARGALRLGHGRTVGERLRGLRQLLGGMARTGKPPAP